MKIIAFEGASDDLIEIEGDDKYDEIGVYTEKDPWTAVVYDPESGDALEVSVWYGPQGTWHTGVGVFDEDQGFPDWPISIRRSEDTSYSTRLELQVPETAYISKVSVEP